MILKNWLIDFNISEELIRFGDLEALFKVTEYMPPYSNQKLLVCTVSIELLDGFQYVDTPGYIRD